MTGRRAVLLITGLLIVGAGIVFLMLGLDQADKAASVTGTFIGLVGLSISVWTYMKPTSSPMATSKTNRVRVTNSDMVQIGDYGTQLATFGPDVKNKHIGKTQSYDEGEQRDGSVLGPGPLQD